MDPKIRNMNDLESDRFNNIRSEDYESFNKVKADADYNDPESWGAYVNDMGYTGKTLTSQSAEAAGIENIRRLSDKENKDSKE